MPWLVRTRLSVMMFLFFFAIGAWAVTLSTYLMSAPVRGGLDFTTPQVGWVYSTFAFGGMLAPLVVGLLADRLFPAERVLGVSALVCAALLFAAGRWCDAHFPRVDEAYRRAADRELVAGRPVLEVYGQLDARPPDDPTRAEVRAALDRVNDDPGVRRAATETFRTLFALMLGYCVSLQLGLTLTTVLAFRNLPDGGHGFGYVRVWGTVGWIAAGFAVGLLLVPVSPQPLYLAAGASAATGVFAFTLPHTPPKGTGKSVAELFGLPALRLFRDPSFGVFVGVMFVCSAMNQFYGVYAHRCLTDLGVPRPEMVMTLGQVVEAGCMFAIPLLGPKRRLKGLLLLGLTGWVLRGAVMTWGNVPAMIGLAVPMHGWSYAFFYIVAASYLDREAPPALRASAQGIMTFVSGGAGVWAGNLFAGLVVDAHRTGTAIDWPAVWVVPLVGCAAALGVFLVFFRPPPAPPAG
jgi:nucleoside transporter